MESTTEQQQQQPTVEEVRKEILDYLAQVVPCSDYLNTEMRRKLELAWLREKHPALFAKEEQLRKDPEVVRMEEEIVKFQEEIKKRQDELHSKFRKNGFVYCLPYELSWDEKDKMFGALLKEARANARIAKKAKMSAGQ
jgi:hypothetical protein